MGWILGGAVIGIAVAILAAKFHQEAAALVAAAIAVIGFLGWDSVARTVNDSISDQSCWARDVFDAPRSPFDTRTDFEVTLDEQRARSDCLETVGNQRRAFAAFLLAGAAALAITEYALSKR